MSVNEEEELRAQKDFYDKIEQEMGRKVAKNLAFWRKVSLVHMPFFALTFAVIYWIAGLRHANII